MVEHHLCTGTVGCSRVMLQVHDEQLTVTTETHAEDRMRLRAKLTASHHTNQTAKDRERRRRLMLVADMVAMAMSLSDRHSLAGLGTTGSSISNLDILDMVPF